MTFPNAGPRQRYTASLLRCVKQLRDRPPNSRNGIRFRIDPATRPRVRSPFLLCNADGGRNAHVVAEPPGVR
jgi:hypothetical protein